MQITISAADLPHQTAMLFIPSIQTKLFPNWLIVSCNDSYNIIYMHLYPNDGHNWSTRFYR